MAMSLGADPTREYTPSSFDDELKLSALNEFRIGDVGAGLALLDGEGDYDAHPLDRPIGPYIRNSRRFHAEMESLASDLEAAGL